MVPPLEEREAALFSLLTWQQYQSLPRSERVLCVAHYRLHSIIEMHSNDAVSRDMDRRAQQHKGND